MSIALAYQHTLHQASKLETLIDGCSRNQRSAQNEVYELLFPPMMEMVRRYYKHEETAREIVNIGLMRVFEKIDQYRFAGSFEGWARRIVQHAITDYAKQNIQYDNRGLMEESDTVVTKDAVENLYYDDLLRLVQSLPINVRIVFNLFAIEGLSHKEIAKELKIQEGTSKWYVSKARKILKEKIEQLDIRKNG